MVWLVQPVTPEVYENDRCVDSLSVGSVPHEDSKK